MPSAQLAVDSRAYDLDGGALARDMATQSVTTDPLNMSATCVFSTGAMDRVGDVVEVSGIRTENHRRNPVVFWNHAKQLTLPIGKTVDTDGAYTVRLADDVATQTTFFSQSLLEAEQIFRLIDEGIINANSIAFDNKRAQPIFAAGVRKGLHVLECDLLEISWVGLPVNPEAVRKAIDSLVCGRVLAEPIRRSLEPYAARAAAWANGVTLKCFDVRAMILKSAEFEESKHPRASDGRFGDKPGQHEVGGESGHKDDDKRIEDRWEKEGVKPSKEFVSAVLPKLGDIFEANANKLKINTQWLKEGLDDEQTPKQILESVLNPDYDSGMDVSDLFLKSENLYRKLYNKADSMLANIDPGADNLPVWDDWEDAVNSFFHHKIEELARKHKEEIREELLRLSSEDEEDAAHDRVVDTVAKLPDRRPDTIISANVALRDEGEWVISLATGEPIHSDDYEDDLSSNLVKILPNIKKLDDLHAINEELETIGDSDRVFYNGHKPVIIDDDIDNPALEAINNFSVTGEGDVAKALEVNDKIDGTGYAIIAEGKSLTKLMPVEDLAGYFENEINAAGLSNGIDQLPEAERAGVAEKWNQFLAANDSNIQVVPDIDPGQFSAIDTAMLDDPDEVAQYIVDQYDLSEGGEARVEWFNDLMAEYGSGDRLILTLDADGDLVVEIADGPETVKGLQFWTPTRSRRLANSIS